MPNTFRRFTDSNPWTDATARDVEIATTLVGLTMIKVETDPSHIFPTVIVAGGLHNWRAVFLKAHRGFPLLTAEDADLLFQRFQQVHRERFPGLTPTEALDAWAPPSAPTDDEIRKAWTVVDENTEDARRTFYGPDGHPEIELQKALDPKLHDPITVKTVS